MKNNRALLTRKLKNYHALNKVGEMNLTKSLIALNEVQEQHRQLTLQLEQANESLKATSEFDAQNIGEVLVPELMGNQAVYVNQLLRSQQHIEQQFETLKDESEQKLQTVSRLKKTNQIVDNKIQLTKLALGRLHYKHMDEEVADMRQQNKGYNQ